VRYVRVADVIKEGKLSRPDEENGLSWGFIRWADISIDIQFFPVVVGEYGTAMTCSTPPFALIFPVCFDPRSLLCACRPEI
jgi:hypothetical protein